MHPQSLHTLSTLAPATQGNHLHIQEVCPTRAQFPLPTLGPKLEAAMAEVQTGRGFYILRCGWTCMSTHTEPAGLLCSAHSSFATTFSSVHLMVYESVFMGMSGSPYV